MYIYIWDAFHVDKSTVPWTNEVASKGPLRHPAADRVVSTLRSRTGFPIGATVKEDDAPRLQTARAECVGEYAWGKWSGWGKDHPQRRQVQGPCRQL